MHHGHDSSEEMRRTARELGLGKTEKFPEGQLNQTDEGEIKIAITAQDGKVIINFGTPVAWFGMNPTQARQLAESLRKNSYLAQNQGAS